ncbi:hypothetical protein BC831DRAFT_509541 [Entophlyctis helioformis]|nr:hypothetical protein BC831DRAFT_509541 [Entophlyctis helioformis]
MDDAQPFDELVRLVGRSVIVRMRPFKGSAGNAPDLGGHLLAIDPASRNCFLLVPDAAAPTRPSQPSDDDSSSDDADDTESDLDDADADGQAAAAAAAAAAAVEPPEAEAEGPQPAQAEQPAGAGPAPLRILIAMGHSIRRIEPDTYGDGFDKVYSAADIDRIIDQISGGAPKPLEFDSQESASASLSAFLALNSTSVVSVPSDPVVRVLNGYVRISPPYMPASVESNNEVLKSQVQSLVEKWRFPKRQPQSQ